MTPLPLTNNFTYEMVDISPELAQRWVDEAPFEQQRRLREHHVLLLAQEMESRSFIPHSSIVFAEYGGKDYLIDGQHRLKAIWLYGKPVKMPTLRLHARSMREIQEWYASIDQGLKRTAGDAIRAQGLAQEIRVSDRQAGRLSAAVRQIATGFVDTTAGVGMTRGKEVRAARSNAFVSRLMRDWAPEGRLYFDLLHGGEHANMYLLERAAVVACGLLVLRYLPEKASEFWREIARDDRLSRDDPRKRFLVWLRVKKEKPANTARAFSVAWRTYLDGNDLKLIRFDETKPIDIRHVKIDVEIERAAHLNVPVEEAA